MKRFDSLRALRRTDKISQSQKKRVHAVDEEVSTNSSVKGFQESSLLRFLKRRNLPQLLLAGGIVWLFFMLLILLNIVWSCESAVHSASGRCKKNSRVFIMLDTLGLLSKPVHRCPIPILDDPNDITIPSQKQDDSLLRNLSYVIEDKAVKTDSNLVPLFGGYQNWKQREDSFKLKPAMKVHCGFIQNGGAYMDAVDREYVKKCKYVVASGIFDGYDTPHQPSNISARSKNLFCFLMVVDEKTLSYIRKNGKLMEDSSGGRWVGVWRLILLRNPPYDEPRRNGKVPKILTHRLFPDAQYSIWIDGKMELIVDPLLILER